MKLKHHVVACALLLVSQMALTKPVLANAWFTDAGAMPDSGIVLIVIGLLLVVIGRLAVKK